MGGRYTASLGDNYLPDGTSLAAIREMIGLFELADSNCPNAKIVAGGYSQGAALAAASIRDVSSSIRDKIVGTVLFGYTKASRHPSLAWSDANSRVRRMSKMVGAFLITQERVLRSFAMLETLFVRVV